MLISASRVVSTPFFLATSTWNCPRRYIDYRVMTASPVIVMDAFCLRSFTPSTTSSTPSIPQPPDEFVLHINNFYEEQQKTGRDALKPGYAPFCKHLFVPNHLPISAAYTSITEPNQHMLVSGYISRTEKELPVLMRWFPADQVAADKATWLDIILYSRKQIEKENAAMQKQPVQPQPATDTNHYNTPLLASLSTPLSTTSPSSVWEWGIVSVKPQCVAHEIPMLPITMMRNALGVNEGGSGVELDRNKYQESVEFWDKHAAVQ